MAAGQGTRVGAPAPLSRHLATLCREQARLGPDHPAVIDGATTLSYAELDARVDAAAAALGGLGIARGATVGLLCTNRWEWLCAAFGAMRRGARVAAFNTFAKAWDLEYMLAHSGTEVLVAVGSFRTRSYVDTLVELIPELAEETWTSERFPALREVVLVGEDPAPPGCRRFDALLADASGAPVAPAHTSAADDAFVVYTSGSSARPKAVPLQHYAAIENGFSIGERMGLTPQDRVWVSVPLFWSYGAVNATPATLSHRATLVLQPAFEPQEGLELIERHACTAAYTLPNMTNALVRHPTFAPERVASLRTGLTLGAPDDIRRAAAVLGADAICNIYGSTETYGNCCVTSSDWPLERRLESQGPPLPGVTLRVADPETGEVLEPGATGELHVTGYVARGYLDAEPGSDTAFGADGWYRTGDLGFLDDDGCLHFVARATEMIKTSGINVAPGEVEEFLLLHDAVRDAAVVGVADEAAGQVVVAFVVPTSGASGAALSEAELRGWCRARIAGFKVPARFHLLDELPKTDTGKLARRELPALDAQRAPA